MAVTTSPTYHQGSPVHDGFATIRSSRNRLKARNLADFPITPAAKEQKHAEYFTIRRSNRQSFLDANSHVVNGADSGVVMNTFANSKHVNGVVGSTNGTDIRPILRKSLTFNESDFSRENADRRSCSTRDSPESTEQNCDHTTKDSVDALNDMQPANYSKSPQKFATLNMRRPRSIDLRSTCLEQPFRRNGFYSEPNTPVSPNGYEIYRNTGFPSSNESTNGATAYGSRPNGFQRSVSENNGFLTLGRNNGLRHSFAGSRPKESFARVRPHKCCECVTGVPHEEVDAAVGRRTLDTLYETQDPKVGCQTILRPKPPVPWWELAIKKSRYKSCPNFDEAHVVSAFEQSLSNMTQRLHQLTATAERKDSELTELRQTIELLRKQSIQAGLTTAHMQSMGISPNIDANIPGEDQLNSSGGLKSSPQHRAGGPNQVNNGSMTRHLSTDSVSSLSSGSSAATDKKHKKKGWLRSSFTKAFSRNAKISKTAKHSSLGQLSSQDSSSMGSQQNHYDDPHTIREGSNENSLEHSHELLATDKPVTDTTASDKNGEKPAEDSGIVDELKRQLREKDLVLTDIRLEALSSAHQLESLKDTVIKMRSEMMNLKQNNERLQRLVTSRSLTGSQSSLGATAQSGDDPRRYSLADQATLQHQSLDVHSQSLDLDFSCLTSTPTLDFASKLSPSCQQNDIYGKVNGCGDVFSSSGLNGRLSATDCDINTVLPPPKSRELAIGESYSDIGITDNQGDASDGKKISIAVYLGQPETFPRYFEEQQDTMTEAEFRFYAKRSSSMFNNHHTSNFDSPRASHVHSPESVPEQDFQNRSNTNSLKSNKSTRSFKTHCNCEPTNTNEFTIAYTYISGKTTWQNLDYTVRKTFKDFLSRIDPGTNLGLNTDSITSYHLGEATRGPEISFPDLLPCGYIIGTVKTLYICLQGVGSLAFDSLIPKNIVYRYISLLSEHRRVILCGPSGTGKSYLAARLAEFYVQKIRPRANPAEAVATFNVDHKTAKELRQYLVNIAEQCNAAEEEELRSGMADPLRGPANGDNMSDTDSALPAVIILDNLHHASALGEAFSGLLTAKANRLPVIIGTMSQATCNTTNLQLHHNFRWLLTANHMEPVKGFLARYLRRKLFAAELSRGHRDPALGAVLEWLPGVWQTLNAFLEQHSSSDVTIGPRLFLACPMDVDASQAWFADVWNYSVVPYVSAAAREGVALYGRRPRAANSSGSVSGAGDPLVYVKSSYPWLQPNNSQALRGIALEDIGLDTSKNDSNMENNEDPLLNMLMRLQEAANYGGNQSQDSDNASIDSNLHDNSADNDM